MGTKKAVYEWVSISDDLVYECVRFSKARYMNGNGVGFEILARTPVPQLPPSSPPPPASPPPRPTTTTTHTHSRGLKGEFQPIENLHRTLPTDRIL